MATVVSLIGWDRSGSTLLAGALGSMPGAITVGEVVNLWHRGARLNRSCSCGSSFSECVFWSAVTEEAFHTDRTELATRAEDARRGLGNAWLVGASLPHIGSSLVRRGDGYAEMLDALYTAIAHQSAAEIIIDASKTPWHAFVTSRTSHVSKVVHIVRDPRGVAHSLGKTVAYDDSESMNRHSPAFSTAAWVYRNALSEVLWRDKSYVCVRYEDLVTDPAGELARVGATLGIGDASVVIDDEGRLHTDHAHNVAGNPNRFDSGPTLLHGDDGWRSDMPAATQRYVMAVSWPLRRRYGYV